MNQVYRPDIDGLRALAVISVVTYHAWPGLLPSGFVGVDIFFVISGYLISSIIFKGVEQRNFSFKNFYARRIKRIFPALILVFTACLLMGWFVLFADEYQMLGKHVASGAAFISNFTLLKEAGYFDASAELKPFLHLWSLGIEEQFYIVWPLLIYAAAKKQINLLALIIVIAGLSFGLNVWRIDAHLSQTFYHPLTRFWELMLGAVLAHISLYSSETFKGGQKRFANSISSLGLILVAVALLLLDKNNLFPGWWAILPTFGAVMLIAAGPEAWINKNVLALRPLVFVGLISFPLYLWHWPLLSFFRIVESGDPPSFLLPIVIILAVVLAWLTYAIVEKRLRHHPSSWVVIGLVVVATISGLVGKVIQKKKGLPDRPAVAHYKELEKQMTRQAATDSVCTDYVDGMGEKRLFDYCRANNLQAEKWIAIIGDSHAHALFPGFAEELDERDYGTILLANSSCPPLVGTATGKTATEREICTAKIEQILSTLDQEKRIEKVLIATRGPVYITGNGFGPAEKDTSPVDVMIRTRQDDTRAPDPLQIYFNGLAETIKRISENGQGAAYFLENPELGVLPKNGLGRPFTFVKKHADFSVDVNAYTSRTADYRVGLFEIKDFLQDFSVLDPEALFCDEQFCRGLLNNQLMYADDDHLSVAGSRYVASKLVTDFLEQ